ncbi:MAG: hypothetical protein AB1324_02215 [Candidatus Micrarchaeota archaeon]
MAGIEKKNPFLQILYVFNRTISYYHLFTITAIIILDVLFTAYEAALLGLSAATFGLAAAPSILMYGFADIGLMVLGFFLTLILELLMGRKPIRTAFSLGLLSALFLAIPAPVFTVSVLVGKGLVRVFPEREEQKKLE